MEQSKKIIWINLAILFLYTAIIHAVGKSQENMHEQQLYILIMGIYPLITHLAISIFLALVFFFKKDQEKGQAFVLSTLIILLVGFSACWGSTFLSAVI
jgi:cytochrome bd-type quinol oxidase subunit 2